MLVKKPEWLDSSNVNLFPLSDLVRRISGSTALRKQQGCVSHFVQQYVETLKTYRPTKTPSGQEVYEKYVEMKSIRDVFLDFLPALYETELNFAEVICEAFENMYNTLTCAQGFDPNARQACPSDYEIYKIHIWELFICVIVYLRNIQDYAMIHTILTHTFFLVDSCLTSNVKVANYCKFRFHSEMIEEQYKPSTANKSKFTLVGHTLCNEREKRPIYTKESIAEADLFLYQVCNALELSQDDGRYDPYWFPTCYVYAEYSPNEWSKMVSRDYCKKKMFLLFGVDSIEKLKEAISHCTYERDMRYNGCFEAAPSILSLIDLEKIGTVN
jgi:predicted CopG family antitoxin